MIPDSGIPEGNSVVVLRQLTKEYVQRDRTIRVLKGIDLHILAGSFTAIMGPSGAGKSTLLHLIGVLDRPTSGSVSIEGRDVSALKDFELSLLRRRRIGFLFQFFNLLPNLSTWQNIALPLLIDGVPPKAAHARASEIANLLNLSDRLDQHASLLSGGEMQRAALGRALARDPAILLADEPTGNLDSASGEQILQLLRGLADRKRTAIIMVTHDSSAASHADRVIRLVDGKIVGDTTQDAGL
jgi:putative ABC transport system ATP-binding protein